MGDETNFKVTDRRLFNPDGSPREIAPEDQVEKTPIVSAPTPEASPETSSSDATAESSPAPPPPESSPTAETTEDELLAADDPAGFANFVMSIASNAASSLGMMEHPVTHQREVDLELAKHWIDVLGMLQQKTRNNLLAQEAKILESLLADLRMQYVSLTNSSKSAASAPFTGRDIVGG